MENNGLSQYREVMPVSVFEVVSQEVEGLRMGSSSSHIYPRVSWKVQAHRH